MVDILQQGDYKIVLGDSLKADVEDVPTHIGVKYNWVPKEGFGDSLAIIKGSPENISLAYGADSGRYDYTGWVAEKPDRTHLALIYDRDQSAFVLEKIDASLEVNIQPGGSVSADQVKRHAQLARPRDVEDGGADHATTGHDLFDDGEDVQADATNPFDYRHFLEEAKEVTDKGTAQTGAGTPLAGGKTPLSGFSSPHGGHARGLQATTPSFGPLEIIDPVDKEIREWPDRRRQKGAKGAASRNKAGGRKKPTITKGKAATQPKSSQIKSQEIVVDSDSDGSTDASDRPSPVAVPARRAKGHTRNLSAVSVAEDDDSSAGSGSSPARKKERPVSRQSNADIDMPDADEEEDENAKYFQDDDEDEDQDADVDGLILDEEPTRVRSPSPDPIRAPKPIKPRKASMHKNHRPRSPSPPGDDMDMEGGIAAELEAELEAALGNAGDEDDDDNDNGVGLGIAVGGGDDDESDISEEE